MTTADNTLAGLTLVPALVKDIPVPVACPTDWCKRKHAGDDAQKFVEDIDHSGAHVDLMSPDMDGTPDRIIGYACLAQDLYSRDDARRIPYLVFGDTDNEEIALSLDQGLVFADRLVEFADRIRGLVGTARRGTTGVADVAFSAGLDAIDAALKASTKLPQTRAALRNAVDLYADEACG
jgi:hypothetical protein